ncbi:MAG: thiosulfate oxidation carrier protein SoxY [Pseudomonadales bacterium]|jgi:sulfur-oxidizing protein SoxY|nr:thiosulfate oxidation carrier protein SoxY [Pseudomonadales bacterium]MDP4912083.1 thiosulfate oxidation carrier protein SoxY [Pseudomonadales bacterium]
MQIQAIRQPSRRRFIQGLMSVIALSALPFQLLARSTKAFQATKLETVQAELFGDLPIVDSSDISLDIPDIAENGAVVPVSVSTTIEGAEAIYVVIEKNPNPLSASFKLTEFSAADVSMRVKMGKSSMVTAYIKTPTTIYKTGREVKVTIGGCGG